MTCLIAHSSNLTVFSGQAYHRAGKYATGLTPYYTLLVSLCVSWLYSSRHYSHIDYTTQQGPCQVKSFATATL